MEGDGWAIFKVLFWHFLGETEESLKNISQDGKPSCQDLNSNPQDMNQEYYPLNCEVQPIFYNVIFGCMDLTLYLRVPKCM
jgi:hypothetical protein